MAQVRTIEVHDQTLVVHWRNGHISEYDLLWLRDNCSCAECGNRAQGQKRVSVLQIHENPGLSHSEIGPAGKLELHWQDDHHVSTYAADWLQDHCYCDDCRDARRPRRVLWDCTLQNSLPEHTLSAVLSNPAKHRDMLADIVNLGFCLVHDVPTDRAGFQCLLDQIGYVRETNYGRICDLKVTREGRLLGETNAPIPLHTDECYRYANPGMLAFHCLSSSEDGGGANLLADGFKLADLLRKQDPETFSLLCRVAMVSRRHHAGETDLISASPVISLDREGHIQGIRYNERSAAPLDLPAKMIRPAYRALRKWLEMTRNEVLQLRIQMRPGDTLVFDNQRVLHGRDTFHGRRHLLYAQLDLDEPHSRHRILARSSGRPQSRNHSLRAT